MKSIKNQIWPINQLFIFLSAISIVFLTIKFASSILVPFLIAIAISIILSPSLTFLQSKRIPKAVSLSVIICLALLPLIFLGGYVGEEAKELTTNMGEMQKQLSKTLENLSHSLSNFGITFNQTDIKVIYEKTNLTSLITNLASETRNQFSNIFIILFTASFMLMESESLYRKVLKIGGGDQNSIDKGMNIIEKIKSYFLLKVQTSLLTALWALGVLWFYDIDYLFLWATLAFFLNFIPVIGSIIAAVPPILMAIISQSWLTGFWICLWYIIINTIVGNIIEPKIMGKGLGLSPLVIFISMTFWGWLLGPAGMILSVPLTMLIQFLFDQYEETKWFAYILGDNKKEYP